MILIDCYNGKNFYKRETMKYTHTLIATAAVALFTTGCVKPTQDNQVVYDNSQAGYNNNQAGYNNNSQSGYNNNQTGYNNSNSQPIVYEEAAPIVYEEPTSSASGVNYGNNTYGQSSTNNTYAQIDSSANNSYGQVSSSTNNNAYGQVNSSANNAYGQVNTNTNNTYEQANNQPVYNSNPYESVATTTYPDPYANQAVSTYSTAPAYQTNSYPTATPVPTSSPQAGGVHLQVAALKDYYAAEEFKNRLSLAPGQSAYIQRGAMNKVIVAGISSVQEANALKETRFPGAFIVQGGSLSTSSYATGSYTAPAAPSYDTGSYTTNNPYGSYNANSSYSTVSGIGVQIGAFSSNSKAQDVADMNRGQYSPVVKKIGSLYKVILTGFTSRSAAKAYASRVGGFVVNSY